MTAQESWRLAQARCEYMAALVRQATAPRGKGRGDWTKLQKQDEERFGPLEEWDAQTIARRTEVARAKARAIEAGADPEPAEEWDGPFAEFPNLGGRPRHMVQRLDI